MPLKILPRKCMSVAKKGKVFEQNKLLQPLLDTSEGTKITWISLFLTIPTPTVYSSGHAAIEHKQPWLWLSSAEGEDPHILPCACWPLKEEKKFINSPESKKMKQNFPQDIASKSSQDFCQALNHLPFPWKALISAANIMEINRQKHNRTAPWETHMKWWLLRHGRRRKVAKWEETGQEALVK